MKRKHITIEPSDLFNVTGEYFTVEAWMLHLGFTDSQVLVYAHIRNLNKRGISGLSFTRMASVLNKSRVTISECAKALEGRGFLRIIARSLPNGAQTTSTVEAIEPELVEIRGIRMPPPGRKSPIGISTGTVDAPTPPLSVYRQGESTGRQGTVDTSTLTLSVNRRTGGRHTDTFNIKKRNSTTKTDKIPTAPTKNLRYVVDGLRCRGGAFNEPEDRSFARPLLQNLSAQDWNWLQGNLPTQWFDHCVDLASISILPSPKQAANAAKDGSGFAKASPRKKTNRGSRCTRTKAAN